MATAAFGPATAALLLLLWVMIGASVWHFGPRLPPLRVEAFSGDWGDPPLAEEG